LPRVLLVAATTGYQIRSFHDAARRCGLEVVVASDRCHVLNDPWCDGAIPVQFHDEDGAVRAIVRVAADRPLSGVVAVGDRPALIAALAARALGLRGSPSNAVRIAGHKLMTRTRLHEAGLPSPWFTSVPIGRPVGEVVDRVTYPCVVKPLTLSASRGVMRADTFQALDTALERLRQLLQLPDVRAMRDPTNDTALIEEYVPGREISIEGVVTGGALQVFAIFDKPDLLEGPFFEETIYVTPPLSEVDEQRVTRHVAEAVDAFGLTDGPIHAECRLTDRSVYVIEVAARPIGGLCSKALRFMGPTSDRVSLEEVLLRHAVGEPVTGYRRAPGASGVLMIPIPEEGRFKRTAGMDEARTVSGIEEIIITMKPGQLVRKLPEGAAYLGFIFARAARAADAVVALREANRRLRFEITPSLSVV
jgi:biotin carboxylase